MNLFDLEEIQKNLPQTHKETKGVIYQILSASSIKQDISFASKHLELFWEWHISMVLPSSPTNMHKGDVAIMGASLFHSAANYLARALDQGSKGRNNSINFQRGFKEAGLSNCAKDFDNFRNKELAHYDQYSSGSRKHSDDKVILVENGPISYLVPAYVRFNSTGEMAVKMARLSDCASQTTSEFLEKATERLFDSIKNDNHLRSTLTEILKKSKFHPNPFFQNAIEIGDVSFDPQGKTHIINWE
ncbi:MAG: hypothetical protein LWW92_05730 [Rhodocyclales bacterium]|nr:hypothetical protein [Rhodocyclales bacterium]